MQAFIPAVALIALCALAAHAEAPPDSGAKAAAAGNRFAFDLYARQSRSAGNLFFSPASIHSALGMTAVGARGDTLAQMTQTLQYPGGTEEMNPAFQALMTSVNQSSTVGDKQRAFDLTIANALWLQEGFPINPDFQQTVQKSFAAGLENVDFIRATEDARQTINHWVEKKTNDRIKNLLAPNTLTRDTLLVLTNAIYFKSAWAAQFSRHATKDEPFTQPDGVNVTVPIMHATERVGYFEDEAMQAVEIPYEYNRLAMVVLLPKKPGYLATIEQDLTAERFEKILAGLESRRVNLALPKFRIEASFELSKTLKDLGMTDAFDAARADFSGMTTAEKLCIGAVIHKAFVDVSEEGTEAAAATAVVAVRASIPLPEETVDFIADHPFVFAVRHNQSGAILFLGRLINPKN